MLRDNLPGIFLTILLIAFASPAEAQRTGKPFTAEELTAFHAIPHDPAPEELAENRHFLISNEDHLEHFQKHIDGLGGVFVGVGTDQNYVLAGWMKPELMILMDFDQWVVEVHKAYKIAFTHIETPEEFLAIWSRKNTKQMLSWIGQMEMSAWKRGRLKKVYLRARSLINKRLKYLKRKYARSKTPCFLNDAAQYAAIRKLFTENRVVMLRGDFVGRKTLKAIANTTTKYGRPVRALYLSNAEEYFPYRKVFRNAIGNMQTDDKSVILRTIHWITKKSRKWAYMIQSAANFKTWMKHSRTYRIRQMVKRSVYRKYPDGTFVIDWLPKRSKGGKNDGNNPG